MSTADETPIRDNSGHAVIRRIADERIHLLLERAAGQAMRMWGPGKEYDFLIQLAKGENQ